MAVVHWAGGASPHRAMCWDAHTAGSPDSCRSHLCRQAGGAKRHAWAVSCYLQAPTYCTGPGHSGACALAQAGQPLARGARAGKSPMLPSLSDPPPPSAPPRDAQTHTQANSPLPQHCCAPQLHGRLPVGPASHAHVPHGQLLQDQHPALLRQLRHVGGHAGRSSSLRV